MLNELGVLDLTAVLSSMVTACVLTKNKSRFAERCSDFG